jgi:hypothetical protein
VSLDAKKTKTQLIYNNFWIKRKKGSNQGGQAHPSLEYMSGLNMIRHGRKWLDSRNIQFRSFTLVFWHRLQQRKLVLAKKTETQSKTEWPKNNPTWRISRIFKFWLFIYCFCFILLFCLYFGFLVCFFCLLCFCFYKTLHSLCCSTHNPCIQKNHKRILTAIFGSREKE